MQISAYLNQSNLNSSSALFAPLQFRQLHTIIQIEAGYLIEIAINFLLLLQQAR